MMLLKNRLENAVLAFCTVVLTVNAFCLTADAESGNLNINSSVIYERKDGNPAVSDYDVGDLFLGDKAAGERKNEIILQKPVRRARSEVFLKKSGKVADNQGTLKKYLFTGKYRQTVCEGVSNDVHERHSSVLCVLAVAFLTGLLAFGCFLGMKFPRFSRFDRDEKRKGQDGTVM